VGRQTRSKSMTAPGSPDVIEPDQAAAIFSFLVLFPVIRQAPRVYQLLDARMGTGAKLFLEAGKAKKAEVVVP